MGYNNHKRKYETEEERLEARRATRKKYDDKRAVRDKEKIALRNKLYRMKNREACRQRVKRWRKLNPEKRIASDKKAALKRFGDKRRKGNYGFLDTRLVSNYQSKICGICSLKIDSNFHVDHVIPLSRGGEHNLENLQLVHPICNLTKGRKLQDEITELDTMVLREYISGSDVLLNG